LCAPASTISEVEKWGQGGRLLFIRMRRLGRHTALERGPSSSAEDEV